MRSRRLSAGRHLAEHLHEVPALVMPCVRSRTDEADVYEQASQWASIIPATRSFMLAARARGLGTLLTTWHLNYEREAAQLAARFQHASQLRQRAGRVGHRAEHQAGDRSVEPSVLEREGVRKDREARQRRTLVCTSQMTALATAAPTALALVAAMTVPGCAGDESPSDRRRGGGDAASGAPRTTPERPARKGRTPAPRFTALVALEKANAAAVLRGPPWRLVRRLPVPTGPHNVAASADGRWMAVTSPPADRITLVDVRRARVVARPAVPGSPHDVSFARNGHALWVSAERAGRVVKLSVPGGRRAFQGRTAAPPHDLRVSPDGRRVWITLDGLSQVEVRDSTGRLRASAEPGGAPHDLAFQRGTDRIWFSNWGSGMLTVASTRTGRRLGVVAAGAEPHHFAFGLGSLWVSDHGAGRLVRVDPRRRRVRGRTYVGPEPHHVAVAGSRVLVAVHEPGSVAIVNRRGRRLRSIPVGPGPHGIAVAEVPIRPRP